MPHRQLIGLRDRATLSRHPLSVGAVSWGLEKPDVRSQFVPKPVHADEKRMHGIGCFSRGKNWMSYGEHPPGYSDCAVVSIVSQRAIRVAKIESLLLRTSSTSTFAVDRASTRGTAAETASVTRAAVLLPQSGLRYPSFINVMGGGFQFNFPEKIVSGRSPDTHFSLQRRAGALTGRTAARRLIRRRSTLTKNACMIPVASRVEKVGVLS
jgi:hypothetical protein